MTKMVRYRAPYINTYVRGTCDCVSLKCNKLYVF